MVKRKCDWHFERVRKSASRIALPVTVLLTIAGSSSIARATDLVWVNRAPIPAPIKGPGVSVGPNGKIYIIGGSPDNFGYTDRVYEYSPASDSWAPRTPMSIARWTRTATSNGKIYAIGGIYYPTTPLLRLNEAFDVYTNTWETKAPMPTPRNNFSMAAGPDGRIYVFGGQAYPGSAGVPGWGDFWWWLNSVEAYDPVQDSWQTMAPMPNYRCITAAVAANGKIYVIGGASLSAPNQVVGLVEEYDPATNTWAQRASLLIPRGNPAAVLAGNGRIYVSGGSLYGDGETDTVEEYDPSTDHWALVTSLPFPLANQAAAPSPSGGFYLFGGSTAYRVFDTVLEARINQQPAAICRNVTVAAGPACTASASIDGGSFDPDAGDTITLSQSPPGPYRLGATPVTLTVTDNHGESSQCRATVNVVDQTPPLISSVTANPNNLWPPNHKMVPIAVTVAASDNCSGPPSCKIMSVSSNEPLDPDGDWVVTGNLTLNLRAERLGTGNGRVYTVTTQCKDSSGNSSAKTTIVTVPHDQGKSKGGS